MARLPLPLHSYQLRSDDASPSRLVNCFPELMPAGARSQVYLQRTYGTDPWATVGDGPIVATHKAQLDFGDGQGAVERVYVVSGRFAYEILEDKTVTQIGEVGTPKRVDIDSDDENVVFVNEPRAWAWDGVNFTEIENVNFNTRGAADVEFLEGFVLFREPNSDRFFGARYRDVTSFDALDFAATDFDADTLVGLATIQRNAVLFGRETTELYENVGGSAFPFARNINGTIEVGLLASDLWARTFDQLYMVASDRTVRRLDGIQPTRISTHAVEQFLSSLTNLQIERGEAWGYTQDGHHFFGLNFETGTFVYDVSTGEWAERESYGFPRWRWSNCLEAWNKVFAFGVASNKMAELNPDVYTEDATPNIQVAQWTYQTIYADSVAAFHHRFEIDMKVGLGATTGEFSDPQITLEFSDDGGETWHKAPVQSLGLKGKRRQRIVWHNLGQSEERVYRCTVSDPVPVYVYGTFVEAEGGSL